MADGVVNVDFVGNLTAQPELRFTSGGAAVVGFTVACTERRFNKDTQAWEDGDATFMRCSAWRTFAENLSELPKGARVFVKGRLKQRSYETREGENRTVFEVQVDACGPDVKFHPALHNRPDRGQQSRPQSRDEDPWGSDPWASPPAASNPRDGGFGGGFSDEPPF